MEIKFEMESLTALDAAFIIRTINEIYPICFVDKNSKLHEIYADSIYPGTFESYPAGRFVEYDPEEGDHVIVTMESFYNDDED